MEPGNCHELLAGLSDYLDGEASAELCRAIQDHLAGCGKCRVVVDTLSMTVRLYRDLPKPELSAESREKLYKVLDLSDYRKTS